MDLREFFQENNKVALAFSGGTDSAFLLWAAREYGAEVRPYFAKSLFQPEFELEDAKRLAHELHTPLKIIEVNPLANEAIARNCENRCYFCKNAIFGEIISAARRDGFALIIDGTNASDEEGDRPGMRALREMQVRSPLRECGIDKKTVRELSKKAGLFTAKKPSYACLATRIPTGTAITKHNITRVEIGEKILHNMGFSDFRLRLRDKAALLQLTESDTMLFLQNREQIASQLKPEFAEIYLDIKPRQEGV